LRAVSAIGKMKTTKNRQETSYYKDEDASVVERNRDAGHLEELHDAMSVSEKPAHRWTLDTTIVEQKDTLHSMLYWNCKARCANWYMSKTRW